MTNDISITQHAAGVILILSGLIPIYVQLALQIGWLKKKEVEPELQSAGLEGVPQVPESAIKLLEKLLEQAGWMVVVGLILIYFGLKCFRVAVFGG